MVVLPAFAADEGAQGLNIDDFMKTGMVSQPMGVSGQAGKSRPETGVILRDGSDVSRNAKSGDYWQKLLYRETGKNFPKWRSWPRMCLRGH